MKRLWLSFFYIFLLNSVAWSQDSYQTKTIDILPTTSLSIKGDTNINQFGCGFNTIHLERKKEVSYEQVGNEIRFKDAILTLKNIGFDCGHKAINKDFHLLLKTDQYPNIILELTKITLRKDQRPEVEVKIKIAGIENKYTFPIKILSSPISRYVGNLRLDIRDFKLEPPKKAFGLIVLKEEIEIRFDLIANF